ncbi:MULTISPECIES: hypothetical protein [unclassified Mycobacterium]|uniref:hypothetical protein n=1 Tax=unclassified Mycobacterium TaxID=2642494 RepID=UPI000740054C|nr:MULTISPECIES: hypothetical protein [unclassified Mycobacterium]KUH86316.1 hypothetical protein AU187_05940 [Mycobacterium sp. IS-1556]KUH86759.1 hypothetical protein AU185_19415 [Mycobacterium sp. GA-0227b]KUH92037.1 hypothetical protein AU186_06130 [Mycobacterium sp. GA-1999]
MNRTDNLKKMMAAALAAGGVALTLGLTAGPAGATPSPQPGPAIDHSNPSAAGDGSVRTNPGSRLGDGSVRVSAPESRFGDGSVRVGTAN